MGVRKALKVWLGVVALLAAACPGLAAEPSRAGGTAELGEVVYTESKIGQPQEQVTQKIVVITSEEVPSTPTPNRNLSELVNYQSGVFVRPLSRNDANWGSFGGLGPRYNGYLLDGLPIDTFVDAMSLDPLAFERVEMHKGPASVMYPNYLTADFAGNLAPLAGITNFITRDPETSSTR